MKILVIGDLAQQETCKSKLGERHEVSGQTSHKGINGELANYDMIVDFLLERDPSQIEIYSGDSRPVLLISSVLMSLHQLVTYSSKPVKNLLIGFNGLPSFFERERWEITALDAEKVTQFLKSLSLDFSLCDDRVGMVTPRVVCMIINEAYYTLHEGTANREDIDMAMKLGTNYPFGPFEWCDRIGIQNVYGVLSAVYEDTKDERYKICPLLKREYLRSITQP